jgi:hypothetical protein
MANLARVLPLSHNQPQKVNMSMATFTSRVLQRHKRHVEQVDGKTANKPDNKYYYFAEKLGQVSHALVRDVDPTPLMVTYPYHQNVTDTIAAAKLVLWMGSRGVTTHLHYDWSHNSHIMIRGRKRFILYPPEDVASNLYLYPYALAVRQPIDRRPHHRSLG